MSLLRPTRNTRKPWGWLFPLIGLAVVAGVLTIGWPALWPVSTLLLPMVLGHLLLGPRHLPWFLIGVLATLSVATVRTAEAAPMTVRIALSIGMIFAVGLVILLASFRRSRLGVAQTQGESMLVDLRDRILRQGELPPVPAGWYAESALRSADGTPFAGDFLVASRPDLGPLLHVCLVDVSGKGDGAGTRALLLSGALGGLIGAMPPDKFLEAANDFLLRQDWAEGFATAVHVVVDFRTGDFEVRSAGHPPPLLGPAGAEGWRTIEDPGPALGLIEGMEYDVHRGRLEPGDVLLCYTDGVVESRSDDISLGIEQLSRSAVEATAAPVGGVGKRVDAIHGAAARLIDRVGSREDDRGIMLVHRRPT